MVPQWLTVYSLSLLIYILKTFQIPTLFNHFLTISQNKPPPNFSEAHVTPANSYLWTCAHNLSHTQSLPSPATLLVKCHPSFEKKCKSYILHEAPLTPPDHIFFILYFAGHSFHLFKYYIFLFGFLAVVGSIEGREQVSYSFCSVLAGAWQDKQEVSGGCIR